MASKSVMRPIARLLAYSARPVLARSFAVNASSKSSSSEALSTASGFRAPCMGIGSMRSYCEDVTHMPQIVDPDIEGPFHDLMAASWDEIPESLLNHAKKAISKASDDKHGQEILANVFRAAEAVEQFSGVLVSLRMELDDISGMSGENVRPLSQHLQDALSVAYNRYMAYLDAFGPDESYLKKKVEYELGTKMIHLKMRCSHLGSDWGKITLLGTSGLSGSYVEHRAP